MLGTVGPLLFLCMEIMKKIAITHVWTCNGKGRSVILLITSRKVRIEDVQNNLCS